MPALPPLLIEAGLLERLHRRVGNECCTWFGSLSRGAVVMLRVNPKDSKLRESSSSAVRLVREPYHQGAMIFTLADLYPFPFDNHQGFRDLQDGLNPRIGLTDGNVA